MTQRLLIVGGSVRPLVASARAAGFEICAFDFFADWDAQQSLDNQPAGSSDHPGGMIQRIDRFEDIFESKDSLTCDAALICGGFENRFDLVRRIAEQVPVLGPTPEELEGIANTVKVFDGLKAAGFQLPVTRLELSAAELNAGWLRKLAKSSSGLGVRFVRSKDLSQKSPADAFFQEKIEGDSVSSVYVSSGGARGQRHTGLLGISRQMVGETTFGAAEFRYCGSVGPIQLPVDATEKIMEIGAYIARQHGLRGVWGIDWMVNQNGVWPIDINPRITASAELYESYILNSTSSLSGIVDLHVRSCDHQIDSRALSAVLRQVGLEDSPRPWVEGKAVLFHCGDKALEVTARLFSELRSNFDPRFFDASIPGFSIADVPWPGQTIDVGNPILTIRVRCHDENEVVSILNGKAKQTFDLLGSAIQGLD